MRNNYRKEPLVCDNIHAGSVEIRDTKQDGGGPVLGFTKDEFAAWLDGAKKGEFDHLAD